MTNKNSMPDIHPFIVGNSDPITASVEFTWNEPVEKWQIEKLCEVINGMVDGEYKNLGEFVVKLCDKLTGGRVELH